MRRFTLLSLHNCIPFLRKLVAPGLVTSVYLCVFFPLYTLSGNNAFYSAVLPVAVASWMLGWPGGLAWSVFVLLLTFLCFPFLGISLTLPLAISWAVGPFFWLVTTSLVVARVRYLTGRIQQEYAERKRIEKALQESEERYRLMSTNMLEAIRAEYEQRELAEALREITAALNSTLKLDNVLDCILEKISLITSFDAVNLMLVDQGTVRIVRFLGYAERGLVDYAQNFHRSLEDMSCLKWMIQHRKPLLVSDTRDCPEWIVFPKTAWIRSYLGIPLIVRDQAIGFLNLNSAEPSFFQTGCAHRLQPFADQAALAIANARAFESTQTNVRRLAIINQFSISLNQPLELNRVLQVFVDRLADALNLDQVGLALFDDNRQHLSIVADHPAPGARSCLGSVVPLQGNLSMDYILEKKTSLLVTNAREDETLAKVRQNMIAREIQTILIIPLIVQGEVIGTVGCDLVNRDRIFTQEEIELAETLTNLATVRIEQARLYTEERRKASELAMLHAISLDITATQDLPTLLQTIVERAAWLLGSPSGTLFLGNAQDKELHCMVSFNTPYDRPGNVQKYGEGAAGIIAKTGKPLIVPNYLEWENRIQDQEYEEPFALIGVPVTWQEKVVGVIQLIRWQPPFQQEDIELLGLFSNQVAISLENARLLNEVQQLAVQDNLTELYNRRGLFEIGNREIDRARRFNRALSALLLDIDHFKVVNDSYGHPVGDQVLAGLAKICRKNFRSIDVLGRYGGEEFLILLLENDLASAVQVAERLCETIKNTSFPSSAGEIRITVSIGVAELTPEMETLTDLIRAADVALYWAKGAGRNQARMFEIRQPFSLAAAAESE